MQISPNILIRVGGLSFDSLERMKSEKLESKMKELHLVTQKKRELKIALSDSMFEFIQGLTDKKQQNILQNTRRDIFNDRKISNKVQETAQSILTGSHRIEFETYLAFLVSAEKLYQDALTSYQESVLKSRLQLGSIAPNENLLKGLVVASQTFLDSLYNLNQYSPEKYSKKEFATELTLLKFATRMCAKTSPFSTFTSITLAKLLDQPELVSFTPNSKIEQTIDYHVNLNNNLLGYLIGLFHSCKEIYFKLFLRINPTCRRREQYLQFLTNNNNKESFQKIQADHVILLIIDLVASEISGLRFDHLITKMQEYVDATDDDCEKYIKNLINIGLLAFDLGVSGTDPCWDLKLIHKLKSIAGQNEKIFQLITHLELTRTLAKQYGKADVQNRVNLLKNANDLFYNICTDLHEHADLPQEERDIARAFRENNFTTHKEVKKENEDHSGIKVNRDLAIQDEFKHQHSTIFRFKPEQMFYEDTSLNIGARCSERFINDFISQLDSLTGELHLFESLAYERGVMSKYFEEKYGNDKMIDFLTFYEDYLREVKKPNAENNRETTRGNEAITNEIAKNKSYSMASGLSDKLKTWRARYASLIAPSINKESGQVNLALQQIKQVNKELGITRSLAFETGSWGTFVQFYESPEPGEQNAFKGVVNGVFPGYGRMMSRFLHAFPQQITDDTRKLNLSIMDEQFLFVENTDSSYSNANLHPPLMPYEVRVPGGHNSLSVHQQLSITDFLVYYDNESRSLALKSKSMNKRCFVFDLGFEAHSTRSPLFQLLDKFTFVNYINLNNLTSIINEEYQKPMDSSRRLLVEPRIEYEDSIILQRKAWIVPKELIPIRNKNESDADYFFRFNDWRMEKNIDDEVFIYIMPTNYDQKGSSDKKIDSRLYAKLGKDDYKPQYVNFSNPLLIKLFEKLLSKTPLTMKMVEMLPTARHLTKVNDEKLVTEYLVEWYY